MIYSIPSFVSFFPFPYPNNLPLMGFFEMSGLVCAPPAGQVYEDSLSPSTPSHVAGMKSTKKQPITPVTESRRSGKSGSRKLQRVQSVASMDEPFSICGGSGGVLYFGTWSLYGQSIVMLSQYFFILISIPLLFGVLVDSFIHSCLLSGCPQCYLFFLLLLFGFFVLSKSV